MSADKRRYSGGAKWRPIEPEPLSALCFNCDNNNASLNIKYCSCRVNERRERETIERSNRPTQGGIKNGHLASNRK